MMIVDCISDDDWQYRTRNGYLADGCGRARRDGGRTSGVWRWCVM
jgi:hypothetical protein